MISAGSTRRFLERWRSAFQVHKTTRKRAPVELDLWEGSEACASLRRADLLESIALGHRPKGKSMPRHWKRRLIFEQIIREVATYRRLAGQVVELNQEYERLREFLSKM